MVELFANSGDPDQTPRSAASDLGLHCLPVTRVGVPSLQLVKHVLVGYMQLYKLRFCHMKSLITETLIFILCACVCCFNR